MLSPAKLFIDTAYAQTATLKLGSIPGLPNFDATNGLWTFADHIFNIVVGLLGSVAFMAVIYSGYLMLTSGGDAAKFQAGRKNLTWSIVGVVTAVASYYIITFALGFATQITR